MDHSACKRFSLIFNYYTQELLFTALKQGLQLIIFRIIPFITIFFPEKENILIFLKLLI